MPGFDSRLNVAELLGITAAMSFLLRELYLGWVFIRGDINVTVIPMNIFCLAAIRHSRSSFQEALQAIAAINLLAVLFIYTFCLSNQLVGVDEDRLNKPHRAIPSGLSSVRGARIRLFFGLLAYLAAGQYYGVLDYTVLWIFLTGCYDWLRFSKYFPLREIVLGVGTIAQLGTAWSVGSTTVPRIDERTWKNIFAIMILFGVFMPTQDFRDMAGDAFVGRKTLPLLVKENFARGYLSIMYLVLPYLQWKLMYAHHGLSLLALGCGLCATLLCWLNAWRLQKFSDPKEDHRTYVYLLVWFSCTLSSVAVLA